MHPPELTTVIYNPAAAAGRVGRTWNAIEAQLTQVLGGVEFVATRGPGDGARRAQDAVERGQTAILSLGGDGTNNEVVNGIMAASPTPGTVALGVLPVGTGGDFARLIGAPKDISAAARNIVDNAARSIDLGRVRFSDFEGETRERYFLNLASFGIGGLVDKIVNESSKRLGGRASFFLGSVRGFLQYRPAHVRLTVDGVAVGEWTISLISVANGRYCGGGMFMAPDAELDDGAFDVVVMESRTFLQTLLGSHHIYRGTHLEAPDVHVFRGKQVVAEPLGENPGWLDIDGEAPGVIPATFDVVPGAISLLGVTRGMR